VAAEAKTLPTSASVPGFLKKTLAAGRLADAQALVAIMEKATKAKAVLWGTNIVGFGTYQLTYAGGRTGDWPVIAFSPRKNDLTLYLALGDVNQQALLARLGKHKTGKSCLYLKTLADVDLAVLTEMIERSVEQMKPKRLS